MGVSCTVFITVFDFARPEVAGLSTETRVSLSPYGKIYDLENPYFYFAVTIRSKEVEKQYAAGNYFWVNTFHPAVSKVTDVQYASLQEGKFPLYWSKMSYPKGELYKKYGARVLGDSLSFEVGRDLCSFAYPAP